MLDYPGIGQRVRKYRKANGLSQEQLAEQVSISLTHMSHIETANTKLSLQVLADLALALGVSVDDLLFDRPDRRRDEAYLELERVLDRCTPQQAKAVTEIAKSARRAMEEYL